MGGFGGGLPIPGGGKGIGGIIGIILVVVVGLLARGGGGGGGGTDITDIITGGFDQASTVPAPPRGQEGVPGADPDAEVAEFTGQVFNDTQDFWAATFADAGRDYRDATLVLFDTPVASGCGGAQAAIGPHYCPPDDTVFIELGFFDELKSEFGAPGDFAQAYVIAHEMGHHVQNVLGTSEEVRRLQQEDPGRANGYSIRLELQADCYAGVWAKTVYDRGLLDPGDIEEGLAAAEAVGDDRIQEKATGRVDPESWNHGSSEQRARWFRQGFDSGRADSCDTFSVDP
jgi:predicted metalloprotease